MKGGFLTTEVLTTPLLFQVVLEGRIPNNRGVDNTLVKGGFLTTEVLTAPLLFQVVLEGRIPNDRGVDNTLVIVISGCPRRADS